MFKRELNISKCLDEKSLFLLGPRQTGKSTLFKTALGANCLYLDLLDLRTFQSFANNPESFQAVVERYLKQNVNLTQHNVVVDEIQKNTSLLNSVHQLIETYPTLRFALTGSSARKLRYGGNNLLGGRARLYHLNPITSQEIKTWPNLGLKWTDLMEKSALPSLLTSKNLEEDMLGYTELYLKEEIQQEALVRRFPEFSRFLSVAAGANGKQIVYEKLSAKAGISAKVAKGYFEILHDTLFGELLPSFKETQKRQPVTIPKFYLFDTGLARFLQGRLNSSIYEQEEDLECFILQELKAYKEYCSRQMEISYWRSHSQCEVDFIVKNKNNYFAIEIKTDRRLSARDFSGLKLIAEENIPFRKILINPFVLSQQREDGIEILAVEDFLTELWSGKLLNPDY